MNTDATFTYGKLNTGQLKVDQSYQRPLDARRIKKIADHFNPLKVNVIKVSHRDGFYYIFDGQHTTKALILRNGNKDLLVDCKIYEGLSMEDEAELFAKQNELEKKVEKNSEMKALYTSGDPEIAELKKVVESVGFIFDFSKSAGTNKIICCDAIYKIFSKARVWDFAEFLKMIKEAWNGEPESLRKEVIGGMWEFYSTYKEDIDTKLAVSKFSLVSPSEIVRDGRIHKELPGYKRFAWTLASKYNVRQKRKLDLSKLTK